MDARTIVAIVAVVISLISLSINLYKFYQDKKDKELDNCFKYLKSISDFNGIKENASGFRFKIENYIEKPSTPIYIGRSINAKGIINNHRINSEKIMVIKIVISNESSSNLNNIQIHIPNRTFLFNPIHFFNADSSNRYYDSLHGSWNPIQLNSSPIHSGETIPEKIEDAEIGPLLVSYKKSLLPKESKVIKLYLADYEPSTWDPDAIIESFSFEFTDKHLLKWSIAPYNELHLKSEIDSTVSLHKIFKQKKSWKSQKSMK